MKNLILVSLITLIVVACDNQAKVLECLDGCDKSKVYIPVELEQAKFTCNVYDLSTNPSVTVMLNFSTLTPNVVLQVGSLNNPSVNETTPLSMLKDTPAENLKTRVGLDCKANFKAHASGTYQFILRSDDGSELSLEGINVINHGGLHSYSSKSVNVILDSGVYALRVKYFQNFGDKGLTLTVKRPGVSFEELVDESFLD